MVQTSRDGSHWVTQAQADYNDKFQFHASLKGAQASMVRIKLGESHPKHGMFEGHAVFGIQDVKINTRTLRPVADKCAKAQHSSDARDKWFLVEVTEFNPCHNPKSDNGSYSGATGGGKEAGAVADEGSAEKEAHGTHGLPANAMLAR